MPLLFALFFLSGATGLVYELIWTRELIFVFGGTTYAITTVLVAFMGGLGLGSYVAGSLAQSLSQPGRTYGLLELFIGLYALCVPALLGQAEPVYRWLYPHVAGTPWLLNVVRFVVGSVAIVLPTICMGATLPILVRYVTQRGASVGRSVGLLYGTNTLGAAVGVLASGFVLIPQLGLRWTTRTAAAANLIVGLIAVLVLRGSACGAKADASGGSSAASSDKSPARLHLSADAWNAVLIAFALSGFAAMVYQIAWTRALVMSLGSSTYSLTCILAAFILGLALGSIAIARWVDRWANPVMVLGILQLAISLSAIFIAPILGRLPFAVIGIVQRFSENYAAILAVELALIIGVVIVPTLLMGAVFPLVTRIIAARVREAAAATGRAYLINTIGTIAGSFLAGFVMIRSDVLGVQNSIWFASVLNATLGLFLVLLALEVSWRNRPVLVCGAATALAVVLISGWVSGRWDRAVTTSSPYLGTKVKLEHPERREILYYAEGVDLTVAVERDRQNTDHLALSVNGKSDASTTMADMPTQLMLGHAGLLLGSGGPDACLIGLGGGVSLAAVSRHRSVERIDCIEISEDVIEAALYFSPFTYDVLRRDPRVHMIRADGRNHLLLTDRSYDLIVSEPSNPWIAGVSNLFTIEYFRLCAEHLKPGGIMVAWLQAYSSGLEEFRMVVRTLCEAFGYVTAWDTGGGDYLLIAAREPLRIDLDLVRQRYFEPAVRADLYRAGINHLGQLIGLFLASDEPLRRWAASAPLHTDDNALLEFAAPRQMLRRSVSEIAAALASLQHSPFDNLLLARPENPVHLEIRQRAARAVRARIYRERARELGAAGNVYAALQSFAEGYRIDPGNLGISYGFHAELRTLRERQPELMSHPKLRPLILELMSHRGPQIAPLRGGTLAEIMAFNRDLGIAAVEEGQWVMAAEYFEAAVVVAPRDVELLQMLAVACSHADRFPDAIKAIDAVLEQQPDHGLANYYRGQFAVWVEDFDEALRRFRFVLEHGVKSVQDLEQDRALADIHDDPRFIALLDEFRD